jgi:hypothetical protein
MEFGEDGQRRQLRVVGRFTVAKRNDTPNEDRSYVSSDGAVCALSDGAAVSFDPGPWAEIVTRRFVEDPNPSPEWIDLAVAEYRSRYDRDAMDWMQQGAFDRGSFATLLGIVASPDTGGVRVFAIGDSLLAFLDRGEVVRTIPYLDASEFDHAPRLLSTDTVENRALKEEVLPESWRDLNVASHDAPKLLLMTDAVGRWLLEGPRSERAVRLATVRDDADFANLIETERNQGRMRKDDCTLLVVEASL